MTCGLDLVWLPVRKYIVLLSAWSTWYEHIELSNEMLTSQNAWWIDRKFFKKKKMHVTEIICWHGSWTKSKIRPNRVYWRGRTQEKEHVRLATVKSTDHRNISLLLSFCFTHILVGSGTGSKQSIHLRSEVHPLSRCSLPSLDPSSRSVPLQGQCTRWTA